MGPHPSVAAVRLAVRRSLADLEPGEAVLVACSGGADSLALLSGTLFEARAASLEVVGVTVDHGLQDGSGERARAVVDQMRSLGADAVEVATVSVGSAGGPEAAARTARYAALDRLVDQRDASAVLLGHTRDDQAETVLLGLARGSGARSLAGMAPISGRYRRPLLGLSRAETERACEAQSIRFWIDPHNTDRTFARVRVRAEVLPLLEGTLGPGVADALARTARQLRDDADALDALALEAHAAARTRSGLSVTVLGTLAAAVRRRVIRLAAIEAGSPPTDLFLVHVDAVDALVTDWHGQQGVDLPGPVRAQRVADDAGGTLRFLPAPVAG